MRTSQKWICAAVPCVLICLFSLPFLILRAQIKQLAALGYLGLFLACFISNASVLLPSSSTLYVVLAATALNPVLCVAMGGLGAALGELCSFFCGRAGSLLRERKDSAFQGRIHHWLQKSAFVTIFFFAFLPLPFFDLIGLAAGADQVSWIKYFAAVLVGKLFKLSFSLALASLYFPWAVQSIDGLFGHSCALFVQGIAVR